MVNGKLIAARAAERALVLSYAPADRRAGLDALLALDRTLGTILRTSTQPVVGQMRLAWWREALAALDTAPPPAEPVLAALAREVLPHGVAGVMLAAGVDGWERLLVADRLDAAMLESIAADRGATLFAASASILGGEAGAAVRAAGEAWALVDMAANFRDPAAVATAHALAEKRWAVAFARRWPARLRALGALALLARLDTVQPAAGGPRRVVRLLWHRTTGG